MIELIDIYKSYKQGSVEHEILKGITLTLDKGEFAAIEGPSGSGKSTLLSIIGLLNEPTKGRVIFNGIDVSNNSKNASFRNKNIGFIFQKYHLINELSVVDNCLLPVRYSGNNVNNFKSKAIELLVSVGLEDFVNYHPNTLSGGQQQRVAIARSLIMSPPLILADEPTGNLDKHNGNAIMRLLKKLQNDHGTSVLMVTHNVEHSKMADRSFLLNDGHTARQKDAN